MVAPDSHRVSLVPWYLGTDYRCLSFRLQVFHFLWRTIPSSSATKDSIEYRLPCNPCPKGKNYELRTKNLEQIRNFLFINFSFLFFVHGSLFKVLVLRTSLGSSRFARRYLGNLYPPRLASKRG